MKIVTTAGDQITAELSDDLEVGEILQSEDGEMYEITEIGDSQITVAEVKVEEDWGE